MKTLLSWEAKEFHYQNKTSDWFWALGVLGITSAIASFIFGNVLFGILLLIATFVITLFATKHPQDVLFEISDRGVRIGEKLYPYQNLHSFWVEDEGEQATLLLAAKRNLASLIVIPIETVSPYQVRTALADFLEEEEHDLPLADRFFERLGF